MKPSDRIHQIASASVPRGCAYTIGAVHVAQYLDEQALDRPEPPQDTDADGCLRVELEALLRRYTVFFAKHSECDNLHNDLQDALAKAKR